MEKLSSKYQKVISSKPTFAQLFNGIYSDNTLMIYLRKNSPYRDKHPFIFQKKANTTFSSKVVIRKIVYINSKLVLIPAPDTTVEQLEEYKKI